MRLFVSSSCIYSIEKLAAEIFCAYVIAIRSKLKGDVSADVVSVGRKTALLTCMRKRQTLPTTEPHFEVVVDAAPGRVEKTDGAGASRCRPLEGPLAARIMLPRWNPISLKMRFATST